MNLTMYQIDAFTEHVFRGNPAAVVPLYEWLPDHVLQSIAEENNLSETAFFAPEGDGFRLRWFAPAAEVPLCGHATLASAYVLFEHLEYPDAEIRFYTLYGVITVRRSPSGLSMVLSADVPSPCEAPPALVVGLSRVGRKPSLTLAAMDYIAVYDTEDEIRSLTPDMAQLSGLDLRGVIVTAPGRNVDFVSRFFAPKFRIPEDPVTGSAHCQLVPYWSQRLNKTTLRAHQLSARGGALQCEMLGAQVVLTGKAAHYMSATITVPE